MKALRRLSCISFGHPNWHDVYFGHSVPTDEQAEVARTSVTGPGSPSSAAVVESCRGQVGGVEQGPWLHVPSPPTPSQGDMGEPR